MKKTYVIDAVTNQGGYLAVNAYPMRSAADHEKWAWLPAEPLKLNIPSTPRNVKSYSLDKELIVTIECTGKTRP